MFTVSSTTQPQKPAELAEDFKNVDAWLPATFPYNTRKSGAACTVNNTYFLRSLGVGGQSVGRTGANSNNAITFPTFTGWASFLIVVSRSTGSLVFGANNPYQLVNGNEGGVITLNASSAAKINGSVPVTRGSVIFARWNVGAYLLAHRNANGQEEFLTATGSSGSGTPLACARSGADAYALIARWQNSSPSDDEIYSLIKNPWQLFKPQNRAVYFDIGAVGGTTHDVVMAESLGFTEDVVTTVLSQVGSAESLIASESHAATAEIIAGLLENITQDDAASATAALSSTQSEATTVADSASTAGSSSVDADETISTVDAESATTASAASISETTSLSEEQVASATLNSGIAEQTSLSEASISESSGISTVSEALTISGEQAAQSQLQSALTESAMVESTEDSAKASSGGVSETVAADDLQSADAANLQIATESVSLTSAEAAISELAVTVTESFTNAEAATAALSALRDLSESFTVSDTTNFQITLVEATLSESFTTSADATSIKSAVAALAESFLASEIQGGGLTFDAIAAELLSITETSNGVIAIFKIPAEVGVQFFVETLRTVVELSPELTVEVGIQAVSSVTESNYISVDVKNP